MSQNRINGLEKLADAKPYLADACQFHIRICELTSKAEKFIRIVADELLATEAMEQGFPMLNGAMLQFNTKAGKEFFADLLQVMQKYGQQRQDELRRLNMALQENELDLETLLRAVLDRDLAQVGKDAEKIKVEPALLEYCLNTALGAGLQQCRAEGLKAEVENWRYGYCPICGGLPSIAELRGKEGKKILHCGLCGNNWAYYRLTCVHCGNDNQKTLAYFRAGGESGYRVDICRECEGYLKVVDSRERQEEYSLEIEDIATLHLDKIAGREGFFRGRKDPG